MGTSCRLLCGLLLRKNVILDMDPYVGWADGCLELEFMQCGRDGTKHRDGKLDMDVSAHSVFLCRRHPLQGLNR